IDDNQIPNPHQLLITNNQPLRAPDVYYPFRSLFSGRTTNDLDFQIEDKGDKFVFRKFLPKEVENYSLVVPQYQGDELVEVDKSDLTKVRYFIPTAEVKEGRIEVVVPKIGGLFSAEIEPIAIPEVLKAKNCNQFSQGEVENGVGKWEASQEAGAGSEENVLRLSAKDANNCSASFYLPDLSHKYAYLISAETKNISGKPLLFWLENLTNRKADIEVYLSQNSNLNSPNQNLKLKTREENDYTKYKILNTEYLIQPPMAKDGLGYTLHFDNISIGRQKTVNELGKISVNPIPYRFLTELKMVPNQEKTEGVKLSDLEGVNVEVNHPNPAIYEITIKQPIDESGTLVLSQAYHKGWKAYLVNSKFKMQNSKLMNFLAPILGKEIKDHVIVNNWENGWNINKFKMQNAKFKDAGQNSKVLDDGTKIILVFWPQYLEWLGFGMLLGCFLMILKTRF
ncbi:MAG: hypothetical protein ACPLY7_00905, partial [Microgenomates group bacterium]